MNIVFTNYHSSSSPKPIPPANASSSSLSSFFASAGFVSSTFTSADGAAAGPALADPEPILLNKFPIFCPVSALENKSGQYFSTLFPDAVINFCILSAYVKSYCHFNTFIMKN